MPTFHFQAMGPAGEDRTDQIDAASADEAMQVLRARGLFVVTLNEMAEGADNATASKSRDNFQGCGRPGPVLRFRWSFGASESSRAPPTILLALFVAGLAAFLFGMGLFAWETRFRAGAKEVTAMKVHIAARHRAVLRIHEGRRVVEFATDPEDTHALGPVDVLYNPALNAAKYSYESDAGLLGGTFFAALGIFCLLAASVGFRNPEADPSTPNWTNLLLFVAGVAVLGVVGCWVIAWRETGWPWGGYTSLFALLMTGLAIAGLAAVKHGFRSLLGQWTHT